ncbi:phosphatase PAP2 family protein [Haladaptatus caseinilyticus]|uniref:phosphatase PAP2 family protein n=1 Tax=Haladaptatus caseinilyticus TaxID=2993314 RepID=UPI00224ADF68|nr:phosphatase PAP2 family protein [Haladaptatus caseinilyticus]
MSRGWGVVELLRETLPGWVPEIFVYVTQLGDAWFLLLVGTLCYWLGDDRERFAFVLAGTLGALSLTLALKEFFALPRPNAALQFTEATGYGFPSGHALGSTVFWGLLALAVDRWSRNVRIVGAVVIVTLVVLSRLILGVHFAVDVVAGVAIGLAYLAFIIKGLRWKPTPTFGLAVVFALAAVLLTVRTSPAQNGLLDPTAAVGGAVGALLLWLVLGRSDESVSYAACVVGIALFGALSYVGLKFSLPLAAVFVINAVVQGGVIAYPRIAGQ